MLLMFGSYKKLNLNVNYWLKEKKKNQFKIKIVLCCVYNIYMEIYIGVLW